VTGDSDAIEGGARGPYSAAGCLSCGSPVEVLWWNVERVAGLVPVRRCTNALCVTRLGARGEPLEPRGTGEPGEVRFSARHAGDVNSVA
jgi:hypothetical protein